MFKIIVIIAREKNTDVRMFVSGLMYNKVRSKEKMRCVFDVARIPLFLRLRWSFPT